MTTLTTQDFQYLILYDVLNIEKQEFRIFTFPCIPRLVFTCLSLNELILDYTTLLVMYSFNHKKHYNSVPSNNVFCKFRETFYPHSRRQKCLPPIPALSPKDRDTTELLRKLSKFNLGCHSNSFGALNVSGDSAITLRLPTSHKRASKSL